MKSLLSRPLLTKVYCTHVLPALQEFLCANIIFSTSSCTKNYDNINFVRPHYKVAQCSRGVHQLLLHVFFGAVTPKYFHAGGLATDADCALVKTLFGAVGLIEEVPENIMSAVTGLSGSGPAYVYIIIEALADAGVRHGLPRATALRLAAQTGVPRLLSRNTA